MSQENGGSAKKSKGHTLADWSRARGRELIKLYSTPEDQRPLLFVPTGLRRLDEAGLLEPDVLTVVGGHPGDGKSSFALQFLEGAARAGLSSQGYFLEDPARLIADRALAKDTGISAFALRRLKAAGTPSEVCARIQAAINAEIEWAERIQVWDRYWETSELLENIEECWTENTKLVVVDYAQAFDAEADEKSVERVIARLAWKLNDLAKRKHAAVVLFSQVKKEVIDRGRQWFSSWRWKNPDAQPTLDMVEGFRPGAGDLQWSSALQQRAKQILYIFRPGTWMLSLQVQWPDDTVEVTIDKGNYGPSKKLITLRFDGATATLSDPKDGKKK